VSELVADAERSLVGLVEANVETLYTERAGQMGGLSRKPDAAAPELTGQRLAKFSDPTPLANLRFFAEPGQARVAQLSQ
jgi:hypothetical protein